MRHRAFALISILVTVEVVLTGCSTNSAPTSPPSVPHWLSVDVKTASRYKFPAIVRNYGLDTNSMRNVASPNIVGDDLGTSTEDGFKWMRVPSNYSTSIDMQSLELSTKQLKFMRSVYVLEQGEHGWASWVHAEFVNLDQGSGSTVALGFANNQVITYSDYLGFDTYSVYRVPGIIIPK